MADKFFADIEVNKTVECVLASDYDALLAQLAAAKERLAEAERLVASWLHDGRLQTFEDRERVRLEMRAFLRPVDAVSACNHFPGQSTCEWCRATTVQPERCCLDYPRCDCNSPPEPDNEWHCSQYPGCECFAGCREKALEAAP